MELDAVERPRTLTRVEKVLLDCTPCVLDSGSTDPLGLSVDVSPRSREKVLLLLEVYLASWTLSVGDVIVFFSFP